MKNTAKKIIEAVILAIMAVVITAPLIAKPAKAMAGTIEKTEMVKSTIGTAIRYKTMPDGMQLINIMGNHDEVFAEMSKIQENLENGTLQSVFLISSLDDVRNTEAHIFVGTEKVKAFRECFQYEGSPNLVKAKKEWFESKGYVIEGYVEFPGDIVPAWAKVIAVKTTAH